MPFRRVVLIILSVFLWVGISQAKKETVTCPAWLKDKVHEFPECPEGKMVPETYPVGAVVVSDMGNEEFVSDFTVEVVSKVVKAAGDQTPLIILPVQNRTMTKVRTAVREINGTREQKKMRTEALLHLENAPSYTWQQDFMQSFFNPSNGKVVLRQVDNYAREGNTFEELANAAKACGFEVGEPLKNGYLKGGHGGGNIETLPGGVCVLGNDHFAGDEWKQYADQICLEGDENRLQAPTDWLQVGHADEIVKVIRNNKSPAPCNFAVTVASPQKALELLKENPNDEFLDFSNARNPSKNLPQKRVKKSAILKEICQANKDIQEMGPPAPDRSRRGRGVSFFDRIDFQFFSRAQAGLVVNGGGQIDRDDIRDCSKMTNQEVYGVLRANHDLRILNELIQEKMDGFKKEIHQKMKNKFPNCEIEIVDVPDLFGGGVPVEISPGKYELPERSIDSILPNPTNAITVNDTVISPDPSNSSFRKHLNEQYEKRGLKSEYVDTFEYTHLLLGNLHCATNTMHVCKPRAQGDRK